VTNVGIAMIAAQLVTFPGDDVHPVALLCGSLCMDLCVAMARCSRAVNVDRPHRGIRSGWPVISQLPRVSGQVIRASSHGDCQPSRQAAREGATAAVTVSLP
jgi:hypothetical protein